jgi:hypothetical protein
MSLPCRAANTSAKTLLDDPDQGKADPLDSGKGRKRKPYRTLTAHRRGSSRDLCILSKVAEMQTLPT